MSPGRSIPWYHILAVHTVVFAVIFVPILVHGAFMQSDAVGFVYPHAAFFDRRLFSWDVLWNDMGGHGYPLMLSTGYVMQPLFALLLALFSPVTATNMVVLMNAIVAASLASLFLQREQYHPWASLAGGAMYAMITWVWQFDPNISYLPVPLALALVFLQQSDTRPFLACIGTAAAVTLALFGLHPQYALIVAVGVVAFIVARTMDRLLRGHPQPWRILSAGMGGVCIAATAGLLRVIPLLAYGAIASRSVAGIRVPWSGQLSLPYFSDFLLGETPIPFVPALNAGTHPYLGAAFLAGVILGALRWRQRRVWGYLLGYLVFLSFVFPVTGRALSFLPFMSTFGNAYRWTLLGHISLIPVFCTGFSVILEGGNLRAQKLVSRLFLAIAVAVALASIFVSSLPLLLGHFADAVARSFDARFSALAGQFSPAQAAVVKTFVLQFLANGFSGFGGAYGLRNTAVVGAAFSLLIMGAALHPRMGARVAPRYKAPALTVACMLSLVAYFLPWNMHNRISRSFYEVPSAFTGDMLASPGTLLAYDPGATMRDALLSGSFSHREGMEIQRYLLPPNLQQMWGLHAAAVFNPLLSRRLMFIDTLMNAEVNGWPQPGDVPLISVQRLVDLLRMRGVQWMTSGSPVAHPQLSLVRQENVLAKPLYLYRVQDSRPDAFFAESVQFQEPDERAVLQKISDPSHNLNHVIVECRSCAGEERFSGRGSIETLSQRPIRADLSVTTAQPQWLILQRSNLPGWEVLVDGAPAVRAIANGLFMAVPVASGTHTVSVRFTWKHLMKDSWDILMGNQTIWSWV